MVQRFVVIVMSRKPMPLQGPIVPLNDSGVISVVRRGVKWANLEYNETINIESVSTYEHVDLVYSDGTKRPLGKMFRVEAEYRARVLSVVVKSFAHVNHGDVEYNFDPEYRTVSALAKRMPELYPNFEMNEIVTVVVLGIKNWGR